MAEEAAHGMQDKSCRHSCFILVAYHTQTLARAQTVLKTQRPAQSATRPTWHFAVHSTSRIDSINPETSDLDWDDFKLPGSAPC
jgi:hypothetical protein